MISTAGTLPPPASHPAPSNGRGEVVMLLVQSLFFPRVPTKFGRGDRFSRDGSVDLRHRHA